MLCRKSCSPPTHPYRTDCIENLFYRELETFYTYLILTYLILRATLSPLVYQ